MIYMPYPDFRRSAKCLSDDHLREQRASIREAIKVLTIPRMRMEAWITEWENHRDHLLHLCDATLEERRRRGVDERGVTPWMLYRGTDPRPEWLGDTEHHNQEKRQLLHLDPKHYARMMWRL